MERAYYEATYDNLLIYIQFFTILTMTILNAAQKYIFSSSDSLYLLNKKGLPVEINLENVSVKKYRKYLRMVEKLKNQKMKRQEKKQIQREKSRLARKDGAPSRKLKQAIWKQKISCLEETVPKVCIDSSFSHLMSVKEMSRLAMQIRRIYGVNKTVDNPLKIVLCNVEKNGDFYRLCREKNCGFENYHIDITREGVDKLFELKDVIYLSPDSPNVLEKIEPGKVYIIGGLVDETVSKHISLEQARIFNVSSARLPIMEHCERDLARGTYKQILTVNQVFEILLEYYNCHNWPQAFSKWLPKRIGFIPKFDNAKPLNELNISHS